MAENRRAVLVGCNYHNSDIYELRGCINDAHAIQRALEELGGYYQHNIKLLTDAHGSRSWPTGANIKQALDEMFRTARPGDFLLFYFSGHGTNDDGDESIVGCDGNLITRYEFRELVNRLPSGASFLMISDSCNSGGLIDKETEQIELSRIWTTQTGTLPDNARAKVIPFGTIVRHLRARTGNTSSNDVNALMQQAYGNDASLKYRLSEHELTSSRQLGPGLGILLSGCQSNEVSMDGYVGGKFCGVFTHALIQMARSRECDYWCSNRSVVETVRKVLADMGYHNQHPCLYSNDANADGGYISVEASTSSILSYFFCTKEI